MIKYLRLLLLPFSLLYALVVLLRNYAYDWGILKSTKFKLPVIVIGNLAVGGTGKSPVTEYLIRLLKNSFKVATLSRGYGRDSKGFIRVAKVDEARRVGDEPLQFKSKYPEITVAVCEDRVKGVERLSADHDIILLDDAFQHRSLRPGFSILLFDYASFFQAQFLLPAGNYRDLYRERRRADIIIITKCPFLLDPAKKETVLRKLKVSAGQEVFFSFLSYGSLYQLRNAERMEKQFSRTDDILLVSGIANPAPLYQYVAENSRTTKLLSYPDHHPYTRKDIVSILENFKAIKSDNKFILTTEKDYQRLKVFTDGAAFPAPLWILPIEASFSEESHVRLSAIILNYCEQEAENKDQALFYKTQELCTNKLIKP